MQTLPSWQIPFLGLRHFPPNLTLFEIETFFSFSEKERVAIRTRRGDHLRLAFGIHLGFLKMTGTTLNAVDRIPIFVLTHVSLALNLPTIDIATVRSLYKKRNRTLYDHQQWVMRLLNVDNFDVRRQRSLIRAFASASSNTTDVRLLTVEIKSWLYTRGIRIPGPRRIQGLALKVTRRANRELTSSVKLTVPLGVREHWSRELFSAYSKTLSHLQWLDAAPRRRSTHALEEAIEKLLYLRLLNVPLYSLPGINVDTLLKLSNRCRSRSPSKLKSISDSSLHLEISCFLRHALLRTNDTILSLCDLRTTDLRRHEPEHETAWHSCSLKKLSRQCWAN